MTLKDFGDEVESLSPAPGGGSCAAYSSLVGVCLSRMMANLSFGKKKFELNDDKIKNEVKLSFEKLKKIKDELLVLVDKDTLAFNEVVKAMKMPKETDEEKSLRKDAIEEATWQSIEVPYRVATLSFEAMKTMYPIYRYGNENALTDVGVAYLMCATGSEGAILNIKINLGSVIDMQRAKNLEINCNQLLLELQTLKNEILNSIHEKLKI